MHSELDLRLSEVIELRDKLMSAQAAADRADSERRAAQQAWDDELASLQEERDRIRMLVNVSERERRTAIDSMEARAAELDALRRERDAAQQHADFAETERREAQQALEARVSEMQRLREERDRARLDAETAERESRSAMAALSLRQRELDELNSSIGALRNGLDEERRRMEERVTSRESTLAELRHQRDEAARTLETERHARTTVEAELAAKEAELQRLDGEIRSISKLRDDNLLLSAQLGEREDLLRRLELQKKQLDHELKDALSSNSEIQQALDSTMEEIHRLQRDADRVRQGLNRQQRWAESEPLETGATEMRSRRLDGAAAKPTIHSFQEAAEYRQDPEAAAAEFAEAQKTKTTSAGQAAKTSKSDPAEWSAPANQSAAELETEEADFDACLKDARMDAVYGLVFDSTPAQRDDLTRVSGISSAVEEKLNQTGVYTYAQIMHWSPAQVEAFSKLFSFRTRIQRDDWVGQAAELQRRKRIQTRISKGSRKRSA